MDPAKVSSSVTNVTSRTAKGTLTIKKIDNTRKVKKKNKCRHLCPTTTLIRRTTFCKVTDRNIIIHLLNDVKLVILSNRNRLLSGTIQILLSVLGIMLSVLGVHCLVDLIFLVIDILFLNTPLINLCFRKQKGKPIKKKVKGTISHPQYMRLQDC